MNKAKVGDLLLCPNIARLLCQLRPLIDQHMRAAEKETIIKRCILDIAKYKQTFLFQCVTSSNGWHNSPRKYFPLRHLPGTSKQVHALGHQTTF